MKCRMFVMVFLRVCGYCRAFPGGCLGCFGAFVVVV